MRFVSRLGGIARSAGCAALAAFLFNPAVHAAPLDVTFQLDWRFEASSVPYIVAKSKGYFAAEGLNVTLNVGAGSAATITRLAAGNADMGVGDISSFVEFVGNNGRVPAKAVFLMYESTPAGIFTLKKSGITRPADLKGLTVAAPVNDGARKIFPLFAQAAGLPPDGVKWMSVEPAIRETLLVRGQVPVIAGYATSALVSLQRLGVAPGDIVAMMYADHGVDLYGNAVFATPRFIEEHPEAVAGFLRALARALKDIAADPQDAVSRLKAFDPLIDAKLEALRLGILLDRQIVTPHVREAGVGDIDPARLQASIDKLVGALALKSRPDGRMLVDMRFLPAQAERMIAPVAAK
ncbi:MAG: ABC transporter substrate-binding protein [Pigmentiphaga sp.]|uniref:ABC transporter substrate-binding protein n=1 Tax=Pigmentiphaga sp. TaxID=1977564 RepID=UPI0029BD52FC|nr:ABC transporter substrate-binding protein [Pigmentiphaga sp.]MDX3906093.1 ABC transporter substrate-binding protein [Pigmentiphaga sp.]